MMLSPDEDPLAMVEQLEQCAGEIYRRLADRFAGENESLSRLFEQLSIEEEQHAHRVALLGREMQRDPHRVGELVVDLGQVRALLIEGEALLRLVSEGPPISVDEARQVTTAIEERFAAAHAEALASTADPALKRLFEELAAGDRAHAALLRRIARD